MARGAFALGRHRPARTARPRAAGRWTSLHRRPDGHAAARRAQRRPLRGADTLMDLRRRSAPARRGLHALRGHRPHAPRHRACAERRTQRHGGAGACGGRTPLRHRRGRGLTRWLQRLRARGGAPHPDRHRPRAVPAGPVAAGGAGAQRAARRVACGPQPAARAGRRAACGHRLHRGALDHAGAGRLRSAQPAVTLGPSSPRALCWQRSTTSTRWCARAAGS